ncbi:MAG: hypothetical protein ACQEVT_16730 [Pseudomonadota bacterium]|uniref:hypothetical protein n=1 Tax=Roseovarius salincola TaxID=2978479 RepID=UPI0022A81792|nr:hypothetical protein [Roseovarius sp. EGI FJ00037]MCZ0812112.1 hypothetical protein [Roseovarius sp. EGI FJ00037]
MTDETYTRQQARADKRAIFNALRSLKHGDTGPADRLTEMSRRNFLATSAAALTVAPAPALPAPVPPALPAPAASYISLPTPAARPTSIYPPVVSQPRNEGLKLGGGSIDFFQGRRKRLAEMRREKALAQATRAETIVVAPVPTKTEDN